MITNNDPLLPCPFCGGPASINEDRFLFWKDFDVHCIRCCATTGGSRTNTEQEAVNRWNAPRTITK